MRKISTKVEINDKVIDSCGTAYLNAACLPRCKSDINGNTLFNFSWVEFSDGLLCHASHRWFNSDASVAYQEDLFNLG